MERMQLLQLAVSTALLSLSTTVVAQAPDCGALPGTVPAGVILTSEAVAADRPPDVNAGPLLVAYCRVMGRMAERSGDPENAANFSCR